MHMKLKEGNLLACAKNYQNYITETVYEHLKVIQMFHENGKQKYIFFPIFYATFFFFFFYIKCFTRKCFINI